MRGSNSTLISIDLKIERTMCLICRLEREALQVTEEVIEEKVEMVVPPRQKLGDYYMRTDAEQTMLGFQLKFL